MNLEDYQQLQPHIAVDGLIFLTPNKHVAWRVETLYTKEPDTVEWISKMKEGEVLFDVGACMGGYSLLAAKQGVRVHAMEPEGQNFALLCRNIGINKLNAIVTPWPIAISNKTGFDLFYSQSLMVGGSCSSYAEEVNFHLQPKKYAVTQGCAAITIDDFSARYGFPTHIKIDCDGLEHKVLDGAKETLDQVKSVLVELNTHLPEHMRIMQIMVEKGLMPDLETAEKARRKEGSFAGIGNVVFYRV